MDCRLRNMRRTLVTTLEANVGRCRDRGPIAVEDVFSGSWRQTMSARSTASKGRSCFGSGEPPPLSL